MVQYGKALFETLLFRDGRLNFFEQHMKRLSTSSHLLGIGEKMFEMAKDNLLRGEAFFEEKSVVRLTLSDEGFAITSRMIPYRQVDYESGLTLCIYPYKRGMNPYYEHKTICCMENLFSLEYAKESGFQAAIFLDCEDKILEVSFGNIFFMREDSFVFPKRKNLLDGIMQQMLRQIFSRRGYSVSERSISIQEIATFEAVFICNSVMEMMPVCQIGNRYFKPYTKLSAEINEEVQRESIKAMEVSNGHK